MASRFLGRLRDAALDATVVASFDRRGFLRHREGFDPEALNVDMRGRHCVVTGANSGLGYATCRELARASAIVWMICRNAARGEAARAKLLEEVAGADLRLVCLDVSDLGAIRELCAAPPMPHIDVLVHNAGVLPSTRGASVDGLEQTLATNLVGPFALTHGLLPLLERGERARIIWVSSGGMYPRRLSVKALADPSEPFDGVRAYADTKRGMVVASELLAERLAPRGIAVHSMHPGWANTPGVQTSIPSFWERTQNILRSPEEGADTILWLAICDLAQSQPGRFWFDRAPRKTHLLPWTRVSDAARADFWRTLHGWAGLPEGAFESPA